MREKGSFSSTVHATRASEARTRGSVTAEGEQRAHEGRGLDPLVDPREYGGFRRSHNLLVPDGDGFRLSFGPAMSVKTGLDTTGSMGGNVEIAFAALPKVHHLLVQGSRAVLKGYHTQIATAVIQDVVDQFPLQVSQFEPDNEIDRQMTLLVPEKGGGDAPEDYQLDLFATAFMTETAITRYGLRGYYFVVGDEVGHSSFTKKLLQRIFGDEAIESLGLQKAPSLDEVVERLLRNWHAFYLQVGDDERTTQWWHERLGANRVVRLPQTEDLAEVQACIIGLTEGVLDLQSATEFLVEETKISKSGAQRIVAAVSGIPIGLQTTFPNYGKLPAAGSFFTNREDLWPSEASDSPAPKKAPKPGNIDWKL